MGSPASAVLWSAPIPCGPSGHASLVLRVAVPSRAPVFVAPNRPDAGLWPRALRSGSPHASGCRDGATGRPKFLEDPGVPMPCSSTPAGPDAPGHCGALTRPPVRQGRRLAAGRYLEAQWHGLGTGCLRFAVALTVPPTQDSLPAAGQALPGGIGYPQGPYERFPRCSRYIFSSSPKLAWRNVRNRYRCGATRPPGSRTIRRAPKPVLRLSTDFPTAPPQGTLA